MPALRNLLGGLSGHPEPAVAGRHAGRRMFISHPAKVVPRPEHLPRSCPGGVGRKKIILAALRYFLPPNLAEVRARDSRAGEK